MLLRPTLVLLALLALVAGCGGDDEPAADPRAPQLTVPETTETQTTETGTETTPTDGSGDGSGSGGTTAPSSPQSGGGSGGAGRQDSPQNDTPPAPGTPESRFEQFCEQNPGACR